MRERPRRGGGALAEIGSCVVEPPIELGAAGEMCRRATLLLACLFTLACDTTSTTTGPRVPSAVVDPATSRQSVRGILRQFADEMPENQWQLELLSGSMLRLVGGPLESYLELRDKEVLIVGQYSNDGSIVVETVDEDTQIYSEFSRRPGARRK